MIAAPAWPELAAVCLPVLGGAVIKGLTGFGFALIVVPAMALFLPPAEAVAIAILVQAGAGFWDFSSLRGQSEGPILSRLAGGAMIGTPVGLFLMSRLDPNILRITIAALTMLSVAMVLAGGRIRSDTHPFRNALGVGAASGLLNGLAAMPGPPVALYFLSSALSPARARATMTLFFVLTAVIALPGLALAGLLRAKLLTLSLIAMPPMVLGTWLGGCIFAATSDGTLRRLILLTLTFAAMISGAKGLAGLS